MNDVPLPSPESVPLEARARTSRWSILVWSVPLAALLIVVFLGVRALADRGIDVVVTFDQAAGARVDDTKVIYLGAEAGHVTKIQVDADGRRIDMTLRLDPRARRALTTTTKFWLVGAKPTLSDISSVKAAVAGLTIGVAPGIGGAPARHFDGLSEPPVVMPGTAGTAYVLHAKDLGAARTGSAIYFHGQEVGRITATRFVAPAAFDRDIFVFAPYDHLMRPSARFWVASAIQVALGDKGVTANVERLNAVFNGSLELELPEDAGSASASASGAEFTLYPNEEDAESGPTGPDVLYAFSFKGPGGELNVGTPVRLLGFQVGIVKSVRLWSTPPRVSPARPPSRPCGRCGSAWPARALPSRRVVPPRMPPWSGCWPSAIARRWFRSRRSSAGASSRWHGRRTRQACGSVRRRDARTAWACPLQTAVRRAPSRPWTAAAARSMKRPAG